MTSRTFLTVGSVAFVLGLVMLLGTALTMGASGGTPEHAVTDVGAGDEAPSDDDGVPDKFPTDMNGTGSFEDLEIHPVLLSAQEGSVMLELTRKRKS